MEFSTFYRTIKFVERITRSMAIFHGHMGIRLKILGILAGVLIFYFILTQIVYSLVILPSYAALEQEEATEDVHRCLDALQREIKYLETVTHDWAAWDDTYQFVQEKNESYRRSNLLQQTFLDNRISVILFLNLQKEMIWGEVRSLTNGNRIVLPELSAPALKDASLLFESHDSETAVSGIMQTSAGPLIVSSCPITTSDHQGPVRGHLIMGRFLDLDYIQRLKDQTHIDHEYLPAGDHETIVEKCLSDQSNPSTFYFAVKNQAILNGFTVIRDIYGEPALVLRTTLLRHIYAKGSETLRLALISIALAGLVILILMVVLINKTVIGPLMQLTGRVIAIKDANVMPPPLFKNRNDEIGILCREFNSMVDQLKSVNNGLESANAQLNHEVQERRKSEQCLLVNQEKLRALSSQLTLAEERERRRIAVDLHDRISQSLALTQIKIGLLTQTRPAYYSPSALEEIENEIQSIIQDTRTLTFEISPSILYELGVEAAIEWIAESMMPKYGIEISVDGDGQDGHLTDSLRVLIFRSVRELLFNIVKHARANQVGIRLRHHPNCFDVMVSDDGIGFDPLDAGPENPTTQGFGLFSIQERLSAIGGKFDIDSAPGRGTRITLIVPTNNPD